MNYCAGYIRQQENQQLGPAPRHRARLSPTTPGAGRVRHLSRAHRPHRQAGPQPAPDSSAESDPRLLWDLARPRVDARSLAGSGRPTLSVSPSGHRSSGSRPFVSGTHQNSPAAKAAGRNSDHRRQPEPIASVGHRTEDHQPDRPRPAPRPPEPSPATEARTPVGNSSFTSAPTAGANTDRRTGPRACTRRRGRPSPRCRPAWRTRRYRPYRVRRSDAGRPGRPATGPPAVRPRPAAPDATTMAAVSPPARWRTFWA